MDDLVELIQAGHPGVFAGNLPCPVELVREHPIQDVVDEGRLAGAAHPGDGGEDAERERHGDVLQIVRARAFDNDLPFLVQRSSFLRGRNRLPAGQVIACDRLGVGDELGIRPGVHDVPAVLPRAGTDVDDPVRGADGVLVVFDDDQRVAQVAEFEQRLDEAVVIALVQTDAGFVKHVQHPGEAGTDLGRQPDPLCFSPGQGAC